MAGAEHVLVVLLRIMYVVRFVIGRGSEAKIRPLLPDSSHKIRRCEIKVVDRFWNAG